MDKEEPKIGRFLFDSITKGLYDNPLCIFREYIQNSADALDKALQEKALKRGEARIDIQVDTKGKRISMEDNGCGLTEQEAPAVLSSVGESPKFGLRNRGFRGIGRLGGMAYCTELVFTTKARGEGKETINRWNCRKMAEMLHPHNDAYRTSDLSDVIEACSSFDVIPSKRKQSDGFFRVEMNGVHSTRDVLTDTEEVRAYLFQVAPLPFDYQRFPFGKDIDGRLRKEVINYDTYKVFLNAEEELFKPYGTTIRLGPKKSDSITKVLSIEILDNAGKIIGRGWRADRKDLIGQIPKSEGVDGIRVRVGNILIGDGDLLDKVFRQERFNGYFVGEIHAVDQGLVPNSRRDDFEHTDIRTVFYQKLREALGDPLSTLVQKRSSDNARTKTVANSKEVYLEAKSASDQGWVSDSHREKTLKDLRNSRDELEALTGIKDTKLRASAESEIKRIDALVSKIQQGAEEITCSLSSAYSRPEKELIGKVCKHIYSTFEKADEPVKLCRLLVQKLNADRK